MTIILTREEAQQVLDALEYGIDYVKSEETTNKQTYKGYEHLCPDDSYYIKFIDDAMETLRARLAQPEPEPVAWVDWDEHGDSFLTVKDCGVPLYTTLPQREWQGLTAAEMMALFPRNNDVLEKRIADFALAIEAKLKEKNA
jgi:hypothetical protein